eukprot:3155496-Rhodomonas_salina.2
MRSYLPADESAIPLRIRDSTARRQSLTFDRIIDDTLLTAVFDLGPLTLAVISSFGCQSVYLPIKRARVAMS